MQQRVSAASLPEASDAVAQHPEGADGVSHPDATRAIFAESAKDRRRVVRRIDLLKGGAVRRLAKHAGGAPGEQRAMPVDVQTVDAFRGNATLGHHAFPLLSAQPEQAAVSPRPD